MAGNQKGKNPWPSDDQDEQMERIPWAQLLPEPHAARPWLGYLVVGAIVLAAGWVVIGRNRTPTPAIVTLPPASAALASTLPEPLPVPVTQELAAAPLYSEADLMSLTPVEDLRAVVARAEWFVTDFFTSNGTTAATDNAAAHLPAIAADTMAGLETAGVSSYVEWARATDVRETSPDRFDVEVTFRTLAAPVGGEYQRMPVRAVVVGVVSSMDGQLAIADLPAPTPVLLARTEPTWNPVEAEPPSEIASAALAATQVWDADARVASATRDGESWRVVVVVTDASGASWPFAIRIPA